jgi:hypothetical protein
MQGCSTSQSSSLGHWATARSTTAVNAIRVTGQARQGDARGG